MNPSMFDFMQTRHTSITFLRTYHQVLFNENMHLLFISQKELSGVYFHFYNVGINVARKN